MTRNTRNALLFVLLASLLVATRLNLPASLTHLGPIPDASWAAFFLGGFYLRNASRWAFPVFMALSVLVDYVVISGQGMDFFAHYCMSAAYWFLVPAYFALWAGGMLVSRFHQGANARALAVLLASLVVSVTVCHLLSQGSFYWLGDSVSDPTLAGWWKPATGSCPTCAPLPSTSAWRSSRTSASARWCGCKAGPGRPTEHTRGSAMGNRLSRIYTRTGDDGTTGLGDGTRVGKDSSRVNAYGTVDEANSALGGPFRAGPKTPHAADPRAAPAVRMGGELCIQGTGVSAESGGAERHLATSTSPACGQESSSRGGEAARAAPCPHNRSGRARDRTWPATTPFDGASATSTGFPTFCSCWHGPWRVPTARAKSCGATNGATPDWGGPAHAHLRPSRLPGPRRRA